MTLRGSLFGLGLLAALAASSLASAQDRRVSVYVSLDTEYAEVLLAEFEKKTGIHVDAAFDAEANKTVSLVNKIIAEAKEPRADVYWNNECGQTLRLKDKGLLEPYVSPSAATIPASYKDPDGHWTGFAARARVIVWNTKMTSEDQVPKRIKDFADPKFKSKCVMAKPLTGTTLTHVCALYARDGKDPTDAWLESLVRNDVRFVPGNGPAMREVADGGRAFGMTDTDDAHAAEVGGTPTRMIYPDQGPDDAGLLLIPNTVMMIKGAKHPAEAKAFIDWVLSPEVESALARGRSAQIPLHPGVEKPPHVKSAGELKVMPVDWALVGRMIDNNFDGLQKRFDAAPSPSQPGGPAGSGRTATWILAGVLGLAILLLAVRAARSRRGEAAV
jgi:iron(III) transport system substrate-binding protein